MLLFFLKAMVLFYTKNMTVVFKVLKMYFLYFAYIMNNVIDILFYHSIFFFKKFGPNG